MYPGSIGRRTNRETIRSACRPNPRGWFFEESPSKNYQSFIAQLNRLQTARELRLFRRVVTGDPPSPNAVARAGTAHASPPKTCRSIETLNERPLNLPEKCSLELREVFHRSQASGSAEALMMRFIT
jgi:hypothetical protein